MFPPAYGSKPADGGHLIVEGPDHEALLNTLNHDAANYIRPLLCTEEYLYNVPRWCLWLVDAPPDIVRRNRRIRERVELCRAFRERSYKASTRELANSPTVFARNSPAGR